MKILMITAGSHGDVHPFLAVGRAARERGHDALLLVHPYFSPAVAAAGVRMHPVGGAVDFEALIKDPRGMHPWTGTKFVFDSLFTTLPDVLLEMRAALARERPDVVVAHPICFGARWVAAEAGVPCVFTMLQPGGWMAKDDPIPVMQRTPSSLARFIARLVDAPLRVVVGRMMSPRFSELRRRLGMPPARDDYFAEFRAADLNLGLWSPRLRGPCRGDPAGSVIVGFPWYDRPESGAGEADAIERFLSAGAPPIVFTLGTAAVHVPGDFHAVAIDAARALGRRAILLTGSKQHAPRTLPAGVAAFDYAPFSRLFPRAAAVVHHGGIGSTAQTLRSGRPAVVVPHAHDQFHNALLCRRLGVAETVHRTKLTPARLARALRVVLDDPAVAPRAASIGAEIAREDGATGAIIEVERFLASRGGSRGSRHAVGVAS